VTIVKVQRIEKQTFVQDVLGPTIPPQIANRIFASFDRSGNGYLTWKDFLSGMVLLSKGTPDEKAQCM
jgi:Ca2+-binding EF-hand superfamily protein